MDARKPTPPQGERPSDGSYPQHCLSCRREWTHIGVLGDADDEDGECPDCGMVRSSLEFYRWWLVENLGESVTVTATISAETAAAADELVERLGWERRDALAELVEVRIVFEDTPVLGERE